MDTIRLPQGFKCATRPIATRGPQGRLLTGGSAFGLAATDGVTRYLAENEIGHPTPMALVPLVCGAVVYDLLLGDPTTRPGSGAGYAACQATGPIVERGSVGAGTGTGTGTGTVGKLLGPAHWTKGGLGAARMEHKGASIVAIAVVNPLGDVIAADGSIAAGAWKDAVRSSPPSSSCGRAHGRHWRQPGRTRRSSA